MSELQIIESALSKAAQRRRWAKALRGLWMGLLAGAVASLLLNGVCHLRPLPVWVVACIGVLPFPFVLAGLILGGWRRLGMAEAARWVDGREHLKERLSTALEVAAEPKAHAWRDLVVADAAAHARQLDPRRVVRLSLPPRVTRWVLVVLAAGVGLGFVPEYQRRPFLRKQNQQQAIREAGRQLSELTRRALRARQPAIEPRAEKALEAAGDLGDRLNKVTLSQGEALKELAKMAGQLKDELRDLNKDAELKSLEQAARSAAGGESQTAAGLQKQIEALQKQLGSPTGKPEALDKLAKDLQKLQEAAKGMSDKNSSSPAAQREELSKALSTLSRQVQEMGLEAPKLDDAIKALEANQTDLLVKDLQASAADLEKLSEAAKSLQQLQAQMAQTGKDLAEQLKNGQAEAARMTLEKMAAQLKAANLPPEQLGALAQEVAKAIKPASPYGAVAAHLAQAGKAMASGNKPGAAKSLAEAAKELERLAQQMADAQSLEAELKALDKAAASIASGRGWRAASKTPRAGKGGGTSSGVGTWADENAQWDGQWSDHWDNSGIERPDEDPRGHTDRGEGELSDALKPTKVRGQFSPGNQMPSVTLRNVSIKGQSKVDYSASAAAAQSDAQSALTHDQVPRAYQGAVKDYFDDLKK